MERKDALKLFQDKKNEYDKKTYFVKHLKLNNIYLVTLDYFGWTGETYSPEHQTIQFIGKPRVYNKESIRFEVLIFIGQCFDPAPEYRNFHFSHWRTLCYNQLTKCKKLNSSLGALLEGGLLQSGRRSKLKLSG